MTAADVTVVAPTEAALGSPSGTGGLRLARLPAGGLVARLLALTAAAAVLVCTGMFVALHLLPASGALNPVATPLSDYALTRAGWLFDVAVGALILGVACLLAALIVAGELGAPSWPAVVTALCCVSLAVVVLVPNRTLPDGALTSAAELHWVAAMTAFAGLPVAPLLLARRHRTRAACSWLPRIAGWLSAGAVLWFAVLLLGSLCEFAGERIGWRIGGVVERALTASEVCAALLLATWIWTGCRCRRTPAADQSAAAIGTPGR
jgi:hypothetical protein